MRSDTEKEVWLIDQLTKSQFFHQKLHEWELLDIIYELESIKGENLDWDLENLSISTISWNKVIHKGIKPIRVFAHPEVLMQDSRKISYYRMLAMVSQKSMAKVGLNINKYENGARYPSYSEALEMSNHLNRIISTLIEYDETIDDREFDLWRGMTAGSQAQGSWGNMKGDKAEVVVKELIERKLKERGLIIEETSHGKSKTLKLNDGRILIFGTEPDIGIYESTISTMVIQIAIEIKGGIDPAAALERFGASLKSLRRAKQDNINSITILIMQNVSLTSKAQDEIKSSSMTIDYLFTIDDLISNEESMDRLFKVIKI